jgi:hypothetical protein
MDKKHGVAFMKQSDTFEFLTFATELLQSSTLPQGERVAQSAATRQSGTKLSTETVKRGEGINNGSNKSQDMGEGLKALDVVLPRPMFVGVPYDPCIVNLEKPVGRPRPPFFAPLGTSNVALHKPVTATERKPIIGSLRMITDGDKEAGDGHYVELGPFVQSTTIDLGADYELCAILIWHYHKEPRVYSDVVVRVADDPDFMTNVKTVFNNDVDDSAGLGIGTNMHYVETYEGKLIDCLSQGSPKARYVRLYSNGNTSNDLNHYVEVEVYGRPVTTADPLRGDYGAEIAHRLLADSKSLEQAIANLTPEDQIGYAKVLNQQRINGQLRTLIRFVETARDNKLKKILEKEYTIEGDLLHFDGMVVKFGSGTVVDGARALYLWKTVYGDKMVPREGFVIEQVGTEPRRYSGIFEAPSAKQSQEFWSRIWDLAYDTDKLKEYGVEAANVNVVSPRLRKGLIYVLKISPTGQVHCETVPDI